MTDEQKRKLEIPWATVLPLVAVLAGIIAQYKPLVSVRPAVPGAKVTGHAADQNVDARLWQDPLGVVQKAKNDLDEQLKKDATRTDRHSLESLARHLAQSAAGNDSSLLLLPVMLDSGPYLEQAESRLRARRAVLEALSEADFIPVDGEHIGFVLESQWPLPRPGLSDTGNSAPLFFSWEECIGERDPSKPVDGVHQKGFEFQRVVVLWLPATRFNRLPLQHLMLLLQGLKGNYPVRLIGPASSNGLEALYREVTTPPFPETPLSGDEKLLDRVKIFSARATASDEWLQGSQQHSSIKAVIEEKVRSKGWADSNFEFNRTILADDVVLKALIDELALRDIHVGAWKEAEKYPRNGDHIVILSEWDNAYGRALSGTFQVQARRSQSKDIPEQYKPNIHPYHFMHGIDGRLPSDSSSEESRNDSTKKEESSTAASAEATEGSNQSDFLRRLAKSLKQQEQQWLNKGDGGIRAIGVLGSDIYDKLMVLRALRPVFPNAVFFTNNYDAHFERLDAWEDTHNLIVASPFTGTLEEQKYVAPFRDNNQTAMYAGTLRALGKIEKSEELRPPYVMEVGRRGVYELPVRSSPTPSAERSATPPPPPTSPGPVPERPPERESTLPDSAVTNEYTAWLYAPGRRTALLMAGVGIFLLAAWIILSMADRRLSGGGDPWPKLKRALTSTPVWLVLGIPIIIGGVATYAARGEAALEPLKFVSGISIWPSEMLRLIALLLAIHFIVKARVELDLNEAKVTSRFRLEKLPKQKWRWRNLRLGLRRWHKEHPEWMKESAPLTAKDAWTAYLWRNHYWPRAIRVTALVAIYFLFALGVFRLFPAPVVPARGPAALAADSCILYASVLGLMVLTFYVVDAIRLTSSLIRIVTGGVTEWEAETEVAGGRVPPLTNKDLARYYDITFVAERTEVIARLIWYPLIVLSLMILARSSYFDNWTWPYSLLLIFSLNALWAFGAAALLRRAAEQLRTEAISKLQALRVASYEKPQRREMFDDLITEIRGLKRGAFAPLSEQPFIRAIILPSGGLGLVAVAQRFLEIF